jgi:hypothetical protein
VGIGERIIHPSIVESGQGSDCIADMMTDRTLVSVARARVLGLPSMMTPTSEPSSPKHGGDDVSPSNG